MAEREREKGKLNEREREISQNSRRLLVLKE